MGEARNKWERRVLWIGGIHGIHWIGNIGEVERERTKRLWEKKPQRKNRSQVSWRKNKRETLTQRKATGRKKGVQTNQAFPKP